MSDKSKNLRKNLSKKGVSQPKAEPEKVVSIQPAADKNYPDPLSMFENDSKDSKPVIDPLLMENNPIPKTNSNTAQFLDLISAITNEKKDKEPEKQAETVKSKILQCRKPKPAEAPMKILQPSTSIKSTSDPPKDDSSSIKQLNSNQIPGRLDKLPELSEDGKNRLLERMKTAKSGVAKNIGKALLKKSNEAILEKAKILEQNVNFNEKPKNVIQDDDVQFIDDSITGSNMPTTSINQNVDFSAFAKPKIEDNSNDSQKDKKVIPDMILKRPALAGKKKGSMPEFKAPEDL